MVSEKSKITHNTPINRKSSIEHPTSAHAEAVPLLDT